MSLTLFTLLAMILLPQGLGRIMCVVVQKMT